MGTDIHASKIFGVCGGLFYMCVYVHIYNFFFNEERSLERLKHRALCVQQLGPHLPDTGAQRVVLGHRKQTIAQEAADA